MESGKWKFNAVVASYLSPFQFSLKGDPMAAMETIQNNTNSDWQSKCKTTQSKLAFLLENEVLSDVLFIVGDIEKESIFAHKFVLMTGSSVMEKMFRGCNQNSMTRTEIRIPDVSPTIFRAILKFLYIDKFDLEVGDTDRVMDLLVASCKYGLSNLIAQCNAVLIGSISEKTAISMYQLAILLHQKELSEYAFDFICRKAKGILSGSDLCTLSKENLKRLARSDALNINEMDLFKTAVKWAKATCQVRKIEATKENLRDVLKDIIPHIRFFLMTAEDVTMYVVAQNILTSDELVQIYRNCTTPNHLRPSMSSPTSMFNARPRNRFWIAERFSSTETRTCWKSKSRGWLCKPKWQYISFKVDQPICVIGIGLYGESSVSVGEYFGTCKPYSYEVRIYNDSSQMLQLTSNTLENPGKLVHVKFDKPVTISPGKWYNLVAKIKSNTATFVGEGGRSHLKVKCGKAQIQFSFQNTTNLKLAKEPGEEEDLKENETNVRSGEIPEIAFYLPKLL